MNFNIKIIFFWVITIVLVCLKLTNLFPWSWWFVFSPIWGCWAIAAILYIYYIIVFKERPKL